MLKFTRVLRSASFMLRFNYEDMVAYLTSNEELIAKRD